MDRWTKAYAFLAAQTKPTEIVCTWVTNTAPGGAGLTQASHLPAFYRFAETSAWKSHVNLNLDSPPGSTYEVCAATVPSSIPPGPKYDSFLAHHGLLATGTSTPGTANMVINYASANGPDSIYRDKPGLFGLQLALDARPNTGQVPSISIIVQPTDSATAASYLQYAQSLLAWYGYKG